MQKHKTIIRVIIVVKKDLPNKIIIFLSTKTATASIVFYLINKKIDYYIIQKL